MIIRRFLYHLTKYVFSCDTVDISFMINNQGCFTSSFTILRNDYEYKCEKIFNPDQCLITVKLDTNITDEFSFCSETFLLIYLNNIIIEKLPMPKINLEKFSVTLIGDFYLGESMFDLKYSKRNLSLPLNKLNIGDTFQIKPEIDIDTQSDTKTDERERRIFGRIKDICLETEKVKLEFSMPLSYSEKLGYLSKQWLSCHEFLSFLAEDYDKEIFISSKFFV